MGADPRLIEGRAALREALLEVLAQTPRTIDLLSYALEPVLYGSAEFADALKRCLLASEQARLRLLLNQAQLAAQNAPRLLDLIQRLPSRIECRSLDEPDRVHLEERLIAAPDCVIERVALEALQARIWRADPASVRIKRQHFEALWARASAATEMRSLGL